MNAAGLARCGRALLRAVLGVALATGAVGAAAADAPAAADFRFIAFGDNPYGPDITVGPAYRHLLRQIDALKAPFAIHVGDFKGGLDDCSDGEFARQKAHFQSLATPLVYTPGDNDWFDCWHHGRDPVERLGQLRRMFFPQAQSLGQQPMLVERQSELMPAHRTVVENVRWQHAGVLFATLHTIGPSNGRDARSAAAQAELRVLAAANQAWVEAAFALAREQHLQAIVLATQGAPISYKGMARRPYVGAGFQQLFTRGLLPLVAQAPFPVLLVHGDGHHYTVDQPFVDAQGRTLPKLWRLEVPGAPQMHAVLVHVAPQSASPFRFELVWNPVSPDPRH